MSQSRRSASRTSSLGGVDKNLSNSNTMNSKRCSSTMKENKPQPNQRGTAAYKVLGQDREMTEEELWKGQFSDRVTPASSRLLYGSSPLSTTPKRTPTPSKQISLQAVKRKEEISEPLEPIDWNDFNRAISQNEDRLPTPVESDSETEIPSPTPTPMSEEARLALVEQRAEELISALSTCSTDEQEADLSKKLDEIDIERAKQRQLEESEVQAKRNQNSELVNQNSELGRNEFSYSNIKDTNSDKRKTIDQKEVDDILVVKRKGEDVIGKHAMDKVKKTAMSLDPKPKDEPQESESGKKNEASANNEETSSDEESEDEDLIGEKGKAPNALLMEFVTCLMEKDYENAEKLCKMILIYEPENPEALNFLPVIQEKRQLDAEEPEGSDESDDESDDSGEDEDDDSDDDDDDRSDEESGNENDDDDDDDGDDDDESDEAVNPDSGIASANSD